MEDEASRTVAPYGAWVSPLPIERLTEGVVFFAEPHAEGDLRWWLEGRPAEGGRQVLVRREADGSMTRLTPEGFNARSRVHEYGGGASLIDGDLVVVSDFTTGRLQRVVAPERLEPITPERAWRFADMVHDARRSRLIAVREDHEPDVVARNGEWLNDLVAIDLANGDVTVLDSGADFYAAPRVSRDGTRLAWLRWDHPNLPWDGTELLLAELGEDGSLAEPRVVAGSRHDRVSQPRWSPQGTLHFVAEPDGWMNLFRLDDAARREGPVAPSGDVRLPVATGLARMEAEFAPPDWIFGNRSYDFLPDGSVLAVGRSGGRDRLYRIAGDGSATVVDTPYTEIPVLETIGWTALVRGGSPLQPAQLAEIDIRSGAVSVLGRATPFTPERGVPSVPEHIVFPTRDGRTAHANLYRPHNERFRGPDGELPPLIVTSHGGPTSAAFSGWTTTFQLWATRGFALVDVDYGGSTGYGREYRDRLRGEWGIVDVEDCVAAARWLAEQGIVDGSRVAIRGASASGFTTLAALAFTDSFSAGTTLFGIGDLRTFVRDTHKFESRYLEGLIGPWPEKEQLYLDRSPALHADRITAPVLVQQGAEDRVVPPTEAETIVDALFERHVPHAYVLFPGEDHGFRSREAIIRSFSSELSFYGQVFAFEPADDIEPVVIAFLDEWRQRRTERSDA